MFALPLPPAAVLTVMLTAVALVLEVFIALTVVVAFCANDEVPAPLLAMSVIVPTPERMLALMFRLFVALMEILPWTEIAPASESPAPSE